MHRHATALLTALLHSLGSYFVEEAEDAGQVVRSEPVRVCAQLWDDQARKRGRYVVCSELVHGMIKRVCVCVCVCAWMQYAASR